MKIVFPIVASAFVFACTQHTAAAESNVSVSSHPSLKECLSLNKIIDLTIDAIRRSDPTELTSFLDQTAGSRDNVRPWQRLNLSGVQYFIGTYKITLSRNLRDASVFMVNINSTSQKWLQGEACPTPPTIIKQLSIIGLDREVQEYFIRDSKYAHFIDHDNNRRASIIYSKNKESISLWVSNRAEQLQIPL